MFSAVHGCSFSYMNFEVVNVGFWLHFRLPNEANVFCFLSSLPLLPPSHHGSLWLLPVISLLLTNTVSPVKACLSILWKWFRGTQKEDDRGPLIIQSSLDSTIQKNKVRASFTSQFSSTSPICLGSFEAFTSLLFAGSPPVLCLSFVPSLVLRLLSFDGFSCGRSNNKNRKGDKDRSFLLF